MVKRDEKGRFVRTKPDYKVMYKNKERALVKAVKHWTEAEIQRDFLLSHAGPILRWVYKRKFKKG